MKVCYSHFSLCSFTLRIPSPQTTWVHRFALYDTAIPFTRLIRLSSPPSLSPRRSLTFTNTFQILPLSWHPSAIALRPSSSPFSPPYFPLETREVSGTSFAMSSSAWKTDTSVSEEDEQLNRRVITEYRSWSGQSLSLFGHYRPCRYA
jgi:hypothetical protein